MYTEEDITSAVTKGIFSQESAEAFRDYMATQQDSPAIDEEDFRLVTSFNDIFVVIICLLLLASVALIAGSIKPWIGALAETGTAWALAEIFTRKRHMALPSILLAFAFVGGILMTVTLSQENNSVYGYAGTLVDTSAMVFTASGTLAAIAAWLHWWRFHVPITIAAGVAVVSMAMVATAMDFIPDIKQWMHLTTFLIGLIVFTMAMRWDMSDPERLTRRSDVAFWLHLLAAPLLVEPIFMALGVSGGSTSVEQGLSVLGLYLVIAFISLSIDRRALMASALFYVLYTLTDLLKEQGLVNLDFAITALIIGSALLILSIFWHPARAFVLRRFPHVLQSRLPPSRQALIMGAAQRPNIDG
jgi:hypothetical protein